MSAAAARIPVLYHNTPQGAQSTIHVKDKHSSTCKYSSTFYTSTEQKQKKKHQRMPNDGQHFTQQLRRTSFHHATRVLFSGIVIPTLGIARSLGLVERAPPSPWVHCTWARTASTLASAGLTRNLPGWESVAPVLSCVLAPFCGEAGGEGGGVQWPGGCAAPCPCTMGAVAPSRKQRPPTSFSVLRCACVRLRILEAGHQGRGGGRGQHTPTSNTQCEPPEKFTKEQHQTETPHNPLSSTPHNRIHDEVLLLQPPLSVRRVGEPAAEPPDSSSSLRYCSNGFLCARLCLRRRAPPQPPRRARPHARAIESGFSPSILLVLLAARTVFAVPTKPVARFVIQRGKRVAAAHLAHLVRIDERHAALNHVHEV